MARDGSVDSEDSLDTDADDDVVSLHPEADPDDAAAGGGTPPDDADPAAAATPAVIGPRDEYNIFDVTPAQIQARIAELNARNVAGGAAPLSPEETLELALLEWWEANLKYEDLGPTERIAAGDLINEREAKIRRINGGNLPWTYFKNYAAAKTAKIVDIKGKLRTKLDATTLSDPEKTALIDATEKKLTDQDHTLASMQQFLANVDSLDPATMPDAAAAQNQLQTQMQPLVIRSNPAIKPKAGQAPSAKVPTNKTQKVEVPKVNPFVLESKSVMGQMAEAFFKSFMLWPWQIVFEVGMRMVSEALSKPYGFGMTIVGGGLKISALAAQGSFVILRSPYVFVRNRFGANLNYLDVIPSMRTLDKLADDTIKTGIKYDGTLPLMYRGALGSAQKILGTIMSKTPLSRYFPDTIKSLNDKATENLRLDKATEHFENSGILMPLRVICQLPLGSGVWNTLNSLRCLALVFPNVVASGYNIGLVGWHEFFRNQEAAKERYNIAQHYNANTRYYASEPLNIIAHMFTHPLSAILAPAPISTGGDAVKQSGYNYLEGISSWFDSGNMGRWLSDTYKRGTINNNPSIKTVDYFTQQQQRCEQIAQLLKNGTQLSDNAIEAEIKKIADGLYPVAEMDAYIEDIKANLDPNITDADTDKLDTLRDKSLKNSQPLNIPRLFLDQISLGVTWWPAFLAVELLAPVFLVVGIVLSPFYGMYKLATRNRAAPVAPAGAIPPGTPPSHRDSTDDSVDIETPAPDLEHRMEGVALGALDLSKREAAKAQAEAMRGALSPRHDEEPAAAAGVPPPPPSRELPTTPPPSGGRVGTDPIASRWPGRLDTSMVLRNPLARIGSPITPMRSMAKRMGFFAANRAEFTLHEPIPNPIAAAPPQASV